MKTKVKRIANRDSARYIRDRKEFVGSNFKAEWTKTSHTYGSQLPHKSQQAMRDAMSDSGGLLYVVYSYATPIAYATVDGPLIVMDHKYSVTTSRHQGYCWYANNIL